MSSYNVDFNVAIEDHLPVDDRLPKRKGWLRALMVGVKALHAEFMAYRAAVLYDLGHNSQVFSIQAALNDVFDPENRGIYISDGPNMEPLFEYTEAEDKPLFEYTEAEAQPIYEYTDAETVLVGLQFIVYVPSAAAILPGYDVVRLRSIVDKYRLPGKNNYSVIVF